MNKVFLILALLFVSPSIYAQNAAAPRVTPGENRRVVNEDRGSGHIITTETQPPLSRVKRTSKLPRQFSIFLGDGWNGDDLRPLEPSLANFLCRWSLLRKIINATVSIVFKCGVGIFSKTAKINGCPKDSPSVKF